MGILPPIGQFRGLRDVGDGHSLSPAQTWKSIKILLNSSSTCNQEYANSNFHGTVHGSGYCNKILACERFARIKCAECGSNVDEIVLENEETLKMGQQHAKFLVNCLSGKRRICFNP
uniref:Uncharacterized protein n=1 Tax=Romanomermis culicivorax TaxID=13658 RepID=A0A915HY50_ROMCU